MLIVPVFRPARALPATAASNPLTFHIPGKMKAERKKISNFGNSMPIKKMTYFDEKLNLLQSYVHLSKDFLNACVVTSYNSLGIFSLTM